MRGLLDQVGDAAVGELGQDGAAAVGAAVGRDLGLLEPGAVGVLEEVVARLDRAVHAGDVEGGWRVGLLRQQGRVRCGGCQRDSGDEEAGCGVAETDHGAPRIGARSGETTEGCPGTVRGWACRGCRPAKVRSAGGNYFRLTDDGFGQRRVPGWIRRRPNIQGVRAVRSLRLVSRTAALTAPEPP